MTDHILSTAHRRVAAELGNLTNHQQHIFAWVAGKGGWKPGSHWGNYSTPSGTLRDVQAVAKKGHLVLDERGTYVVSDEAKALIAAKYAILRAEDKAKDEARQAAYDAQRYIVVAVDQSTGQTHTVGEIYTGRGGSTNASNAARRINDDFNAELTRVKARVIELDS
jgi:hypothetical protein